MYLSTNVFALLGGEQAIFLDHNKAELQKLKFWKLGIFGEKKHFSHILTEKKNVYRKPAHAQFFFIPSKTCILWCGGLVKKIKNDLFDIYVRSTNTN